MLLLTELGARLKEARLAKGYSLEDLQEITKIQKRYLVGIEEGNYSIMPGSFYVRAFIKQYAEAVGLDPEELLNQFKKDVPVHKMRKSCSLMHKVLVVANYQAVPQVERWNRCLKLLSVCLLLRLLGSFGFYF